MAVTIKKIAEVAGVSRGTVDRALNGRSGVKPEVKENILKIADELGYKPNYAAKALADKRYTRKKIGILINSEGNPFFEEVLRGVNASLASLEEFGLKSIIKTMRGYSVETQLEKLEELVVEGANGIVLTPINAPEIAARINELQERGIEVVNINSDVLESRRMAYVGCRIKKSGAVAAGLIGMMNCGKPEKYAIVGASHKNLAVARREQGIIETLEKDFPWIEITDILENEDSEEVSYKIVTETLQKRPDLDGICFAGAGSEGGIRAVLDLKKRLKIVAFDLTDTIRHYLEEGIVLATICQDPYKQGYDGVDIMGKYLIWNQRPETDKNLTDLTIMTKYSI